MSTFATVQSMEKLAARDQAHPAVIAFAEDVDARAELEAGRAGRFATMTDRIAALETLIRERIRYLPDPAEYELIRYPSFLLLQEPEGDCDDMITLAKSVLLGWGVESRMTRLGYHTKRRDPYSHVVLLIPGAAWGEQGDIVLDPTVEPDKLGQVLSSMTVAHVH